MELLGLDENSLSTPDDDDLDDLFDLPYVAGADQAEGLVAYPVLDVLDEENAVMSCTTTRTLGGGGARTNFTPTSTLSPNPSVGNV